MSSAKHEEKSIDGSLHALPAAFGGESSETKWYFRNREAPAPNAEATCEEKAESENGEMSKSNKTNSANGGVATSSRELERIRLVLLAKRQELTQSQATQLSELSDPNDRHHIADLEEMASDTNEMHSLCEIMDIEGTTVSQIDAALDKISEGTYGICEFCDSPIGKARLEALPFAGLCIECQRKKELHPELF